MGSLDSVRLRTRRAMRTRPLRLAFLLIALVILFDALRIQRHIANRDRRPEQFDTTRKHERVYISAMHWNSAVLLRKRWTPAVLRLAELLGKENVFVSVYESGSWDDTKGALAELDAQLEEMGVPRNIVVSNATHQDELEQGPAENEPLPEGWIETSRSRAEKRRIPFLARLRNMTLKDLWDLADRGERFDKVLFLNDVVFQAEDALTLLDTNRGVYAAACSLDFSDPPMFYDTFALRDSNGEGHLTSTWPYFRAERSRDAVIAHSNAVPVKSCWNGIVAMPAAPFTSSAKDQRLSFRAIPDSLAVMHLEGSECCLIHVDNPLTEDLGVYLNPRVRVGYNPKAYRLTHPGSGSSWVSIWGVLRGMWVNRIFGWMTTSSFTDRTVDSRLQQWHEASPANHEAGRVCIINEAHVLVWNGWNHV